jgi:uncharacterized protein (DUF488 family)
MRMGAARCAPTQTTPFTKLLFSCKISYNDCMKLLTIGYEGWTPDAFFDKLTSHQVQTLVDVRELPTSRKKGFAKTALREKARTHGITYVHMRALGCPRPIRHDYRADKDWPRFTDRYLEYLQTQQDALAELVDRVQQEICCLLCMEANPTFCHRRFIARKVASMIGNGITIHNLTQTPDSVALQANAVGRSSR